jgi:hypothetical protein
MIQYVIALAILAKFAWLLLMRMLLVNITDCGHTSIDNPGIVVVVLDYIGVRRMVI